MRRFAVVLAIMLSTTAVQGQDMAEVMMSSPPQAIAVDGALRVSVTLRTAVATDNEGSMDAKAYEAARRALYVMANTECAALAETFKSDCRLNALSVGHPPLTGKSRSSVPMSATAVYLLKAAPVTR